MTPNRIKHLITGAAASALLATSFAAPAMAQDDPRVITADELELLDDRREFRQARRDRGPRRFDPAGSGQYIQTPDGRYVLIEDNRFQRGLRAGHRVGDGGFRGRQPEYQLRSPVRIAPPQRNNNGAIAAGIIGLAAGAIIANELGRTRAARQPQQVRRIDRVPLSQLQRARATTPAAANVASDGWIGSGEWLRYCTAKYRSFNPSTGRFLSYSGQYKICR